MRWRRRGSEPLLNKMAPKRKYKFNESCAMSLIVSQLCLTMAWRSVICVRRTFLYRVLVARMFAGTKRVPALPATLSWRRVRGSTKDGWCSSLCRPWTKWSRRCDKSGNDVRIRDRTSQPSHVSHSNTTLSTVLLSEEVSCECDYKLIRYFPTCSALNMVHKAI